MEKTTRLTIVSASFNAVSTAGRDAVERCIRSVASLPFVHEHLIMDGASKDGTVEFLRQLENEVPSLRVYSEPDTGIYDALNKGLSNAKGEYFYVLGMDDYISDPENMLTAIEQALKLSADVVISPIRIGNKLQPKQKTTIYTFFYRMGYGHQGVMVRTSCMRDAGGFDACNFRLAGDHNALLRVHLAGASVTVFWKPYTSFGMDGCSNIHRREAIEEDVKAISMALELSEEEGRRLRYSGMAGFHIISRLIHHDAIFVRKCGWRLLANYFWHKVKKGE